PQGLLLAGARRLRQAPRRRPEEISERRWIMNLIPPRPIPPLRHGDRLTQAEFHRRYQASPPHVKAELIGGIVYMASPVGRQHGYYSADLLILLGLYQWATSGLELLNASTTILGEASEPEPDLSLRILPEYGGQSRTLPGDVEYVTGAPELVVEVSHTRV